jgi:hypothetical protein
MHKVSNHDMATHKRPKNNVEVLTFWLLYVTNNIISNNGMCIDLPQGPTLDILYEEWCRLLQQSYQISTYNLPEYKELKANTKTGLTVQDKELQAKPFLVVQVMTWCRNGLFCMAK